MVYDLYKLCTNELKNDGIMQYTNGTLYIMHFKDTLIVTYDLILTLFDNIRICFEILA
jgi:hypothetical protein